MNRTLSLILALTLPLLAVGCRGSDCQVVCEQRSLCVDPDVDVDRCTRDCSIKAEDDRDYGSKAQECAQCVEQKTCAEGFKYCLDDCFGV
jgi:hypothetical protein